jgi:hypothetical protein
MQFAFAPVSTGTHAALYAFAVVVLAVAVLFWWIALSAGRMSAEVDGNGLRIHVPIYSRQIPLTDLDLAHAGIVNLDATSPLRPKWRTNGIGLPGYRVGWFKLHDGSKALLAITRRSRVLYVPTRDGYAVLMSVDNPSRLLARLRSAASA